MEAKTAFSRKAKLYRQYRWDYDSEAVRLIYTVTGLNQRSVVADIGAGTGILTRHFAGSVQHVYAVEPNLEMRILLEETLSASSGWSSLPTSAEATGLPDHSVDLITVGTALHWFHPQQTRKEFARILKPGGWLAVLWNNGTNEAVNEAAARIYTTENGAAPPAYLPSTERPPVAYFWGQEKVSRYTFPFTFPENWEVFFGAMASNSRAPDPGQPAFALFEKAARQVFEQFMQDGFIQISGETELFLGQPVLY